RKLRWNRKQRRRDNMPTRRADESSEHIAQERFMSSPQLVARRGILANAVAAKAQLYRSAAHRSLLYFLQGLSMQEGGLKAVAADLVDAFPDRVETGECYRSFEPETYLSRPRLVLIKSRSDKIEWL